VSEEDLDRDQRADRGAGVADRAGPRGDLSSGRRGRASVAAVARDFGISWRTAMGAVHEHGQPRVQDPDRLADVDAVGVDETAFQAAAATRSTSFVTGIVNLTRGRGSARLLDVVAGRSASALLS
jgi:hypothetical protein